MSAILRPEPPAPQPASSGIRRIWQELIVENPMLDQARREQRRFFRSAYGLGRFGPAIILTIIGLLYVWLVLETIVSKTDGSEIYSYIEVGLLTLILPGSIYGAVSAEREKATWEALILTRLTPAQIIAGKLVWRGRMIAWIALLILVPIIASRFNATGGGDIPQMSHVLGAQLMIVSWGVLLCAFGLWISALTRRSITSLAVIAVLLLTVLAIIPAIYTTIASTLINNWGSSTHPDPIFNWMLAFNPFTGISEVISPSGEGQTALPNYAFTGLIQSAVYLALAALLILLTNDRLKRLEEPGLKSR